MSNCAGSGRDRRLGYDTKQRRSWLGILSFGPRTIAASHRNGRDRAAGERHRRGCNQQTGRLGSRADAAWPFGSDTLCWSARRGVAERDFPDFDAQDGLRTGRGH